MSSLNFCGNAARLHCAASFSNAVFKHVRPKISTKVKTSDFPCSGTFISSRPGFISKPVDDLRQISKVVQSPGSISKQILRDESLNVMNDDTWTQEVTDRQAPQLPKDFKVSTIFVEGSSINDVTQIGGGGLSLL